MKILAGIFRGSVVGPIKGFEWEFDNYPHYQSDYPSDDSGFGDLMDTEAPNQISHFVGEAYISSWYSDKGTPAIAKLFIWGNEQFRDQSTKQSNIDQDLGNLAYEFVQNVNSGMDINKALELVNDAIENYDYDTTHPK